MVRVSVLLATVLGCNGDPKSQASDASSDVGVPDTGTPSADTDPPGDTDTDSDTDADTDADSDADTDADSDADTDSDTDADTDSDTDTDTGTAPIGTPGPGCPGSPWVLVQDAIDAAAAGDIIDVCAGSYAERLTIAGKTLTLRAPDGPAVTILDATGGGQGLVVTGGSDVVLDGFTFRNGVAAISGGNIACEASALVLRDSVIESGSAWNGGGVGYTGCTGLVEANTFRSNSAEFAGGGLYVEGTVDIVGNTFESNASAKNGGGALVFQGFGDIVGNVARLNTAIEDGAGIYVDEGAPLVDGNTFEDNDTDGEGGGLRVKLSQATITNNTFLRNHADWRGGGARVSHDESVISGNTWIGNTTWGTGGALFLFESASTLSFERYEDNEAEEGGAIAILEGWGSPVITDSVFDGNEADLGGHVYVQLLLYPTVLRRVDLLNGEADVSGGALYATAGSILDVGNVVLADNTAAVSGGAIGLDGVTGSLHNAVVVGNDAPDGAGLAVTNGAAFDVSNTAFVNNTGGATISYAASPGGVAPTFRYDDFFGNTADFAGMPDAIGQDGNIADAPGFVNTPGGDYTLAPGSALIDAGDPAVTDPDGSAADIGRFGGPDAG